MSALAIRALRAGYGGTEILHGVDCEVAEGEIVALVGRNGVGKSTLLKTIMGLLRVRDGTVAIAGEDVVSLSPHEIARRGVGYLPQEEPLFDELSVRANLEIVLPRRARLSERAGHIFELFPVLAERLGQRAGTLSGGERKMLMLGRVLLQRPRLMLIDEVTEGVQPSAVARIADVIKQEQGTSILLVEQKLQFAVACAQRVLVMKRGQIIANTAVSDGTVAEIEEHLTL